MTDYIQLRAQFALCTVIHIVKSKSFTGRGLHQVRKSEVELQESEQEGGRGEAMGSCCSCSLPFGPRMDLDDRSTEVAVEPQLKEGQKEESQIETR